MDPYILSLCFFIFELHHTKHVFSFEFNLVSNYKKINYKYDQGVKV